MRLGKYTTVDGAVALVQFRPSGTDGWCFLTLFIDVDGQSIADPETYQIDGARYSINGREVTKPALMQWLTTAGTNRDLPRVHLAGNFGKNTYEICHTAEFHSESI